MITRKSTTTILSRAVRTMSSFHRTAIALRSREQTVDEVLRTTVFSPEIFPKVLTMSIWVATLEFYGFLGWKYYSRNKPKYNGRANTRSTYGNNSAATISKWPTFVHQ